MSIFIAVGLGIATLLVALFLWAITQCNPDDEQD